MTNRGKIVPVSDRELVMTRFIKAPKESLYRAWTEPELLKQWFAPLPWATTVAEMDVRPGGSCLMVMRGPDGQEIRVGVYISMLSRTNALYSPMPTLKHGNPQRSLL